MAILKVTLIPEVDTFEEVQRQDWEVEELINEVAQLEDNLTSQFENDVLEEKREGRGRCY